MSDTQALVVGVRECALPEPYKFSIRRHGHYMAVMMTPGYDRRIVVVHASRYWPEEEVAIRQALGFSEPVDPVRTAHEALARVAS